MASKTNNPGKKTESSRNNVLYLILTLKNHSDKNNPLSIKQITEYMNKDFAVQCGGNIDRTTITRLLDNLECDRIGLFRDEDFDDTSTHEDFDNNYNLNFYLRCVTIKNVRHYYYESFLLESELMTLYDAVETYNYFATEDIKNISLKLSSIRPLSKEKLTYYPSQAIADKYLKDQSSPVLMNINELIRIMANSNLARISYANYNERMVLEPRKGYPKTMRPLKLIWSNGFYYCIMGVEKYDNTVNLRIDRITEIIEIEASSKELKKYSGFNQIKGNTDLDSKSLYRSKNPIMYAGNPIRFELLVNASTNNMMNTMADAFGLNIKTAPVDTDTAKRFRLDIGKSKWVKVFVQSSEEGMILFATEYCNDVIIASPSKCSTKVKETLTKALKHYR